MRRQLSTVLTGLILVTCGCFLSYLYVSRARTLMDIQFIPDPIAIFSQNLSSATINEEDVLKEDSNFDFCPLPKMDPWDKGVIRYYNPYANHLKKCKRKLRYLTKLVDGKLTGTTGYYCWGRCLNRKTEWKNALGPWISTENTSFVYDCDVVQSTCSITENIVKSHYGMVHTQIVERREKSEKTQEDELKPKQYNVYLIIIDSISSTQADRNFPKTLRYLEKSMKAVTFPYLNKVGLNSVPNAVALLLGKQSEPVDRSIFNLSTHVESEFNEAERCKTFLDDEPFIGKYFSQKGYKTMIGDDWVFGAFHFPKCKAFDKQPVDHYLKPYNIAVDFYGNPLKKTHSVKNCVQGHTYLLDWQSKFMNSYKDIPKFSYIWEVLAGHNDFNNAISMDTDLLSFLIKERENMDDSFVIFTADHGFRIGTVTTTKLGAVEINNPMLTISVPKELRDNHELMNTLRENSQKLHTHFDVRATMLDIVMYQPSKNFTDRSSLHIPNEKGQSLLRTIEGERSCRTLPIPFAYCICQYKRTDIMKNVDFSNILGQKFIAALNERLVARNVSQKCAVWKFRQVKVAVEISIPNSSKAYVLGVTTKAENSAEFRSTVQIDEHGNLSILSRVDRIDRYYQRGKCVSANLETICDCLSRN